MRTRGKGASPFRAWRKEHNATILKISAITLALCYALSHAGGTADAPILMYVAFGVLALANALAALIK